jgi:hypothetical protein
MLKMRLAIDQSASCVELGKDFLRVRDEEV